VEKMNKKMIVYGLVVLEALCGACGNVNHREYEVPGAGCTREFVNQVILEEEFNDHYPNEPDHIKYTIYDLNGDGTADEAFKLSVESCYKAKIITHYISPQALPQTEFLEPGWETLMSPSEQEYFNKIMQMCRKDGNARREL
jgi:hypothetical protein